MSKGGAFATKNPANAGFFNFRGLHIANRIAAVNTAFVKTASI